MSTRKKQIRKRTLELLQAAKPWLVEEEVLRADVCLILRPNPTLSEFESVIKQMEEERLIVRLATGEGVKAKITEEGEAELL